MVNPVHLVLLADARAALHLVSLLDGHARWCRAKGYPLTRVVASSGQASLTGGQSWPTRDDGREAGDDDIVLLTYERAGRRLGGISVRSVRRLVSEGKLHAVSVGASRRVHVDDLDEYTQSLRANGRGRGSAA